MKRIRISDADIVSTSKTQSTKPSKAIDPFSGEGESTSPSSPSAPQMEPKPKTPPTPKPGRRSLDESEKLDGEFIERIEERLQHAEEWNIGGIPARPGQEGESASGTDIGDIGDGVEPDQIPGGDRRIWADPESLDKEIDVANRQGEENERVAETAEGKKEERTDSVKTKGGKGRGRVRDRIAVERLSQTDWAAIFRSRLTEYSRELAKYLPWNRRFVSSKTLRPKIGSKSQQRDVLPELNLLVDTSSSLSYRECAVVLSEIQRALESTKVNVLNVFLWAGTPYAFETFTKVDKKSFQKVNDWIQSKWEGGGNDEIALYEEIVKRGKAKKFTISLTDAYLDNHMKPGKLNDAWTKALDPANLIFAIIYPNRSIPYDSWVALGDRMPGQKVPVFLDTSKFL